jgi:hypothetical protein
MQLRTLRMATGRPYRLCLAGITFRTWRLHGLMVKGPERWFCKVSVLHGMQVSGLTKYLKGPVLELIFIQVPVVIINLWRPIFIIVKFVIVLWRELNCVKIPQGETNKSANHWGNLRTKVGVVSPSVYS